MGEPWTIRLHRDLKELIREPLEGIQVHVHENDMKHMCLLLSPSDGPFCGWRLHFDVRIPPEYPALPPSVTMQTVVPHPNVFSSGYICCDILQCKDAGYQGYYYYERYNGGYHPGYLLKYIFLQLLSFFTSKKVEQDYGGREVSLSQFVGSQSEWKSKLIRFTCSACGYNKSLPAKVEAPVTSPEAASEDEGGEVQGNYLELLNADCIVEIVDRLSDQDTIKLAQAFEHVRELVKSHNCLLRRQLVCFYLRKTFQEAVLGVGVEYTNRFAERGKKKPVVTVFDLFSYEAFSRYNLKRGVTGASFSFFLPVVLDNDHFRRGVELIRQSLKLLSETQVWSPRSVLQSIPAMMNMTILRLVQSCDAVEGVLAARRTSLDVEKASEKALQGYCLLFHLFSKLVRIDPALANEIQQKVDLFIKNRESRSKGQVPDLGEFLTYLLVVKDLNWKQFCELFLEELLTRNVVWNLKKCPHLAYLEPDNYPSELRLADTFKASGTSLKLVMFQVSFFTIARSTLSEFDQRYGFPSEEMSSRLFNLIKDIYSVKDWDVFLKLMSYPLPPQGWKWIVSRMLKAAVTLSAQKGYHVNPFSPNELYVLRKRVEPRCPRPNSWSDSREEKYEQMHRRPIKVNVTDRSFFPQQKF